MEPLAAGSHCAGLLADRISRTATAGCGQSVAGAAGCHVHLLWLLAGGFIHAVLLAGWLRVVGLLADWFAPSHIFVLGKRRGFGSKFSNFLNPEVSTKR